VTAYDRLSSPQRKTIAEEMRMKVGVAGLGKMGAPIALRLMEAGHQVTVWNRTPDKTRPVAEAGAKVVASPADVAKESEAVITILADGKAIDAVYNGPNGLLSGDVKGKLFIEMSTELPSVKISLAEKVKAKGAALVDCPVGGSTKPAREGKLLGLLGGDSADIARAKPILEPLCGARLEECGGVGGGSAVKLAVNLPLMVAWQAYGEAFAIIRDLGWAPQKLLDLFTNTNGANNAIKGRAPMIVTMLQGGDPGPTTFSISNAVKDIKVMLEAGKAKGVDMPVVRAALSGFEEANAKGLGDSDGAALAVYWATKNSKGGVT
jgi:3-hydroxyisobutyrate dehydrogenase